MTFVSAVARSDSSADVFTLQKNYARVENSCPNSPVFRTFQITPLQNSNRLRRGPTNAKTQTIYERAASNGKVKTIRDSSRESIPYSSDNETKTLAVIGGNTAEIIRTRSHYIIGPLLICVIILISSPGWLQAAPSIC